MQSKKKNNPEKEPRNSETVKKSIRTEVKYSTASYAEVNMYFMKMWVDKIRDYYYDMVALKLKRNEPQ